MECHPKNRAKGKKLPNKHSGITDKMAAYALEHTEFPFHYEERLQQVFRLAAILPSLKDGLTLSGDGTCVHSHASPYGHKVCNCLEKGITGYSCKRHFSDPDTHWGWYSDKKVFYFGHTLYMLCSHNAETGHIRFLDARRHDSVSAIVSLREFKTINPDIPVGDIYLDSVHDNYATYGLCQKWDIRPFIDLNSNWGARIPSRTPSPLIQTAPRCAWPISAWSTGDTVDRSIPTNGAARWPAAEQIPVPAKKNALPYGRCVYTKPDWDIRLYTPVPRGTQEYTQIFNNRTSCERVNNRVLNDYDLHDMGIHTKKRYSFFTMVIGICIHLDTRLKKLTKQVA